MSTRCDTSTKYINYFVSSDPHHDISVVVFMHGEQHDAMVVGFVVWDFARGSSGSGLLL